MVRLSGFLRSVLCALCRYAYLIDAKGRVRWRGSGQATATEADNLVACSKELLSSSD